VDDMRHSAAYNWRRIHSATPQRNALTCRDGCAFLSGEGSGYGTTRGGGEPWPHAPLAVRLAGIVWGSVAGEVSGGSARERQQFRQLDWEEASRGRRYGSRWPSETSALLGDSGTRWPDLRESPPMPRLPRGPTVATVCTVWSIGMDPLVAHQRAQDTFAHVLVNVTSDQLSSPTPCP